jgi:hypothetical protein
MSDIFLFVKRLFEIRVQITGCRQAVSQFDFPNLRHQARMDATGNAGQITANI